MKNGYISTFDFLNDWKSEYKELVFYSEKEDNETAIKFVSKIKKIFEKELINDEVFIKKYTENAKGDLIKLNNVPFEITFSIESGKKYGYKYLIEELIIMLEKNKNSSIISLNVKVKYFFDLERR